MDNSKLKAEILKLKDELHVSIVAHFYQKDEVFELADFAGDSLQLAQWAAKDKNPYLLFCGVGFMGQSVKILAPEKRVLMPKIACCAMARMIDVDYFDQNVALLEKAGIAKEDILPVTYINSSADVKARIGMMGGYVCTSSNAKKIITKALESNKKILFVPDRCLGQNIAKEMGLKSCIVGDGSDPKEADILCYNGFCSVHQLFDVDDIAFYRAKYPGILIVTHPECKPDVCDLSDFVGSTSQIIEYVKKLPLDQKVAIGTEYNMIKRLRKENTYVLSSSKPECPTMNETTLQDVYNVLLSIKEGRFENEIMISEETRKWAHVALNRMFEL
ncbi:quinolinate synthase NadA [Sulfurospirillum multivorans]|uniref:Quinolinate synthase n=2 Tax=Sulfurospirillum multivorans TaxID=66821 RepID=A0AA86AJV0_SULMK|nr:quinolinate synthase NadA [Sulfurospirillum multivorans]AHJ11599.1 quinolinate synthetase A [Sulfurospirillum multivorans DSM 12446]QEH05099.1 quinolinate synthetase A [Sulfurospirillum multivorans]